MRNTLLITGGSGLLALNWACWARGRYDVTLGLHEREVSLAGVNSSRISLDAVRSLTSCLEDLGPQLVVHTAGLTNVETCEGNPDLAEYVNVQLTQNVAEACALAGVPLVHISTDHLFSGAAPWISENDAPAPMNVYARTKGEAETRVLAACPDALVVRTNFYGWGPSYRHSFSDSIVRSLRRGESVTLFEDVFYTPMLVEPLVEAVHDLVRERARGVYHVVGDERVSKLEFGIRLADLFGLDASLIQRGRLDEGVGLVKRPHDMSLSNRKACALLGRSLGGLDEHLTRLYIQEQNGLAREIQKL